MTPRGSRGLQRSTWSETVPGTPPERSSGTVTVVQSTSGRPAHGAMLAAADASWGAAAPIAAAAQAAMQRRRKARRR